MIVDYSRFLILPVMFAVSCAPAETASSPEE
jgi:hypothetical protein